MAIIGSFRNQGLYRVVWDALGTEITVARIMDGVPHIDEALRVDVDGACRGAHCSAGRRNITGSVLGGDATAIGCVRSKARYREAGGGCTSGCYCSVQPR